MKKVSLNKLANYLNDLGIEDPAVYHNLSPADLVEHTLRKRQGVLTDTGALMCDTGKFTGRSPKDRYVVKDQITADKVWWGDINRPYDPQAFHSLSQKMMHFLSEKELYVRDVFVGADPEHAFKLRIVNTLPWQNLFCHNMFIAPTEEQLVDFEPDYLIVAAPEYKATPAVDATCSENFSILNLSEKMILIGGSAYTGEIKKGVFSVLNFILPVERGVMPMHCSANMNEEGETAIFFGLSGTGKTTLSADPDRRLIGDDEHGWTANGIFNFEGGCYAKVIGLSQEKEPQIWNAIRFGALLENTRFFAGTKQVDFNNKAVTENTRVSYPLQHVEGAVDPSIGNTPNHIFFLTCDAYGVLPPISKLTKGQAMYHFISGYTAKVAGTEAGINEPQAVFSACFGAPFMPLHPTAYAEMLGKKMEENQVSVWLVNTGWTGGEFGVGNRMKLPYTRSMIGAALNGTLEKETFVQHPIFGVSMPKHCPGVPEGLLNPEKTWEDKAAYQQKAMELAAAFVQNFDKFRDYANGEILAGEPQAAEMEAAE